MASSTMPRRTTRPRSPAAIAAPTALAASPHHTRWRAFCTASAIIATTGTNGSSIKKNGRGSLDGPSHHVANPSSRLDFHAAIQPKVASTHVATTVRRQPGVSWPGRGAPPASQLDTRRPGAPPTFPAPAGVGSDDGGGEGGSDVSTGCDTTGGGPGPGTARDPVLRHRQYSAASMTTPAEHGSNEVLSIFFPMWNEEVYLERALDAARRVCDRMVDDGIVADYELIIVDDASTDRTPELADKAAAADFRVRVVHHEHNRKLGGSIKTGFATATGDLILYSDADLPFDMEELPRAIRYLRAYDADIVSAYRFDRTGEGYTRAIYTFIYNVLVRTMFGVKARDINFAFKLCRRHVFDHIELQSEGSFIDAELVIRATKLGFQIVQFGVDYFPRTIGESTLSSPGIIATIVREMTRLRRDLTSIQPLDDQMLATRRNDV